MAARSIPPTSVTVADVWALADRVRAAANSSRLLDWPALQVDLGVTAKLLHVLTATTDENTRTEALSLGDRLKKAGSDARRPQWEPLAEDMQEAARRLAELTIEMTPRDLISIDVE